MNGLTLRRINESVIVMSFGRRILSAIALTVVTLAAPLSFALPTVPPGNTVLMFVSYNDVWWAEYKVMFQALVAAGYQVDVRSSETGSATSYQTAPEGTKGLDASILLLWSRFVFCFVCSRRREDKRLGCGIGLASDFHRRIVA